MVKTLSGKDQDENIRIIKRNKLQTIVGDKCDDIKVTAQLSDSLGAWRGGNRYVVFMKPI